jgi:hypothetical protein
MSKLPEQKKKNQRPSILNGLFTRPERDHEYISDLNSQWDQLDTKGRSKFIIGAVFGALVFFAALGLVLWLISAIMGA